METSASNATVSSMSKGIMCILISTKRSLTPGSVHNSQLLTVACWRKKFFIQFLERMKRKNLSPWSPSISYAHAIPEQKNIHKYFMNTSFIEMMQLVMRLLTLLCIYCASILWRMDSGVFSVVVVVRYQNVSSVGPDASWIIIQSSPLNILVQTIYRCDHW